MKKNILKIMLGVLMICLFSASFMACDNSKTGSLKITIESGAGGYVTANQTTVNKGGDVEFIVHTDLGYVLDSLLINQTDYKDSLSTDGALLLKGVDADIVVKPVFVLAKLKLTKATVQNGSFLVKNAAGTEISTTKMGETIFVTATANRGYVVSSIKVAKASSGSVEVDKVANSFVMPAEDVIVTVIFTYKRLDSPDVTFSAGTLSWQAIPNAVKYSVSLDNGSTWGDVSALTYAITTVGVLQVQVKAVGDQLDFYDSLATTLEADNRSKIASINLSLLDNMTDAFVASWICPTGTTSFQYRITKGGFEGKWIALPMETLTLSIPYDEVGAYALEVQALGNETYSNSDIQKQEYAVVAPTFATEIKDKFIVPNGVEVTAKLTKSDIGTSENGVVTYVINKRTLALDPDSASPLRPPVQDDPGSAFGEAGVAGGLIDTAYNANGFVNGVYGSVVGDDGVVLEKDCQYEIKYTLTNRFGTFNVSQFIIVKAKPFSISNVFENAYTNAVFSGGLAGTEWLKVVDSGMHSGILGEGNVLRFYSDAPADAWSKDGKHVYCDFSSANVYLGKKGEIKSFAFYVYNNTEQEIQFVGSAGIPPYKIAAKAYGYFNYYDSPEKINEAFTNGIIKSDGTFGLVNLIAKYKSEKAALLCPIDVYIGQFMVNEDVYNLQTPTNLDFNGTTLSWTAVPNATGYMISLDNGVTWLDNATTSYTGFAVNQIFEVKVKAIGHNFKDSELAYIQVSTKQKLATPILTVEEKPAGSYTLSWNEIAHAVGYEFRVSIDGVVSIWQEVSGTTVTKTFVELGITSSCVVKFEFRAKGTVEYSDSSSAISNEFTIVAPTFLTVPKDMQVDVIPNNITVLTIGGNEGAVTALPTFADGSGTLTYKARMRVFTHDKNSGDYFAGMTDADGFYTGLVGDKIKIFEDFIYEIIYTLTDARGVQTSYTQRVIGERKLADITTKYPDLYNKGTTSGDLTIVDSGSYAGLFGSDKILKLTGSKTATGTFTTEGINVTKNTHYIVYYAYNNTDTVAEIKLGNMGFYKVNPRHYVSIKILSAQPDLIYKLGFVNADGILQPLTFTAVSTGDIDIVISHIFVNSDAFDVAAASVEVKTCNVPQQATSNIAGLGDIIIPKKSQNIG